MPPPSPTTRATLLKRLSQREESAWHEFERTYRSLVSSYCRRMRLAPQDEDDVWQQVLLGLSSSLEAFRYDPEKGRFRGYLFRAVHHAIARLHRQASRSDGEDGSVEPAPDESDALRDVWEREWIDHHYRRAHATLRRTFEPRSVAIFEELLAGRGVAEVASEFRTTAQAVHKIKQRARERLQQIVAEQLRAEDGSPPPTYPL